MADISFDQPTTYGPNSESSYHVEGLDLRTLRHKWGGRVHSGHSFIKEVFEKETSYYFRVFRHEFEGPGSRRNSRRDRIDVNIMLPVVKSMLSNLYYQDPKVLLQSLQREIVVPILDLDGRPMVDPMTGTPQQDRYDGPTSALRLQGTLNIDVTESNLKRHVKDLLVDTHMFPYAAVKVGFGNEQGAFTMPGAPALSVRGDVTGGRPYAIRHKPWDVIPDMTNFYNSDWVALRYTVNPWQLKADKRLLHTDMIKGNADLDEYLQRSYWRHMEKEDCKMTEYFELYIKPCAEYPGGFFALLTDEVPDDFLYVGFYPYQWAKQLPVKFLYFTPDNEGGLPIPGARYYIGQQNAKSNLRAALYEYVQRTVGGIEIDMSRVVDKEKLRAQIQSAAVPRVIEKNGPQPVTSGFNWSPMAPDFHRLDAIIDDDVSRVTFTEKGIQTGGAAGVDLASVAKLQAGSHQQNVGAMADDLREFLRSIFVHWVELYKEFAGDENLSDIEGERFPVKWVRDEIQGAFKIVVQPFSMVYEDPLIRRRNLLDLLNLLMAPESQMALNKEGFQIKFSLLFKRYLETFDNKDYEAFLVGPGMKAEDQVANAISENLALMQGGQAAPQPTDDHKVHIMIHGMLGLLGLDVATDHIQIHQQALELQAGVVGSPGGGNAEGSPINGVAVDQEQMRAPMAANPMNAEIARMREANKGTKTQ